MSKMKIVWRKKREKFYISKGGERYIYMDHTVLWFLSATIAKSFLFTVSAYIYIIDPKTLWILLNFNQKDFFFIFWWIHFHYTNIYRHCLKGNCPIFHLTKEGDKFFLLYIHIVRMKSVKLDLFFSSICKQIDLFELIVLIRW